MVVRSADLPGVHCLQALPRSVLRPRFALDWEECFRQLGAILQAAKLFQDPENYTGAWFIRVWLVRGT